MRLFFPLVRAFLFCISLLPLSILYLKLRFLIFIFVYVFGYRKQVILSNLARAFPNLSKHELKKLRTRYVAHLGDINAEFLKIPSMNKESIGKRIHFTNPEFIRNLIANHKCLIAIGSHVNNWEWGGLSLSTVFENVRINGVYKPLKNDSFDAYFRDVRRRYGMHLVPMKSTLRAVIESSSISSITVLISDQSPTMGETEFVAPFFGEPIPVFLGAEKIARLTGYPVIYLAMHKKRRGYYEITALPVSMNPKSEPIHAITLKHIKLLEEEIRREPDHWLWSHRRWKHAGKEFSSAVVVA